MQLLMLAAACCSLLLMGGLQGVDAWGYKDNSMRKPIPKELHYWNHVPAPKAAHMPDSFNWCDVNGTSLCTASWNQHIPQYCGSCWAHASLSMINDRLKIKKGGKGIDVMMSRQTLLNCASQHGYGSGCDGGDVIDTFRYMRHFGLPDDTCMPYSASDHTKYPKTKYCPAEAYCMNCMPNAKGASECWPIKEPIRYFLTAWGVLAPGEEAMKEEILARGPIVCGAACPEDFVNKHQGGVYVDPDNDMELDHDVEVVGWGVDKATGLKYWQIRNSWGAYWGELGFFKLLRGNNTFNIEGGDCWYAEVEHKVEQEVEAGELIGTMDGLVKPSKDARAVRSSTARVKAVHAVQSATQAVQVSSSTVQGSKKAATQTEAGESRVEGDSQVFLSLKEARGRMKSSRKAAVSR